MEAIGARCDPAQGQIVAGRYELLSLCGKGGMGSVWRARRLSDAGQCAVKILHRTAPERVPHLAGRFLREAKVAAAVDSPNAVRVLDYGVDEGLPFIVMELLEGETLAERLRRSGRMTAIETLAIVEQVARALTRAHEIGVVHRDLKPDNVFLAESGDGTVVAKVLDFGIAKIVDEETLSRDLTETGALLGTPHYMSPEQIDGARYVDHRADLWSLAVMAFECMTGQRPFRGDGLRALFLAICVHKRPLASSLCSVPPGFDAWFAKCTNTDPAKRCRSAAELAEELASVCHGTAAVPEPEPAPDLSDPSATTSDPESIDSLAGSVAVPRGASDSRPWLPAPDGSKEPTGDSRRSPARRFRVPSLSVWGAFALLLLASGAWLSARGHARTPTRLDAPLAPPRSSVEDPPPAPSPSSARVVHPSRPAASFESASARKPEPRQRRPARVAQPPAPSAAKTAAPPDPPAPAAAPSTEPAPATEPVPPVPSTTSAKPGAWDFTEMLKDRK